MELRHLRWFLAVVEAGSLSQASKARFKSALNRITAEFEELARKDGRLPMDERAGCTAILALRDWQFSEFTRFRRKGNVRRTRT